MEKQNGYNAIKELAAGKKAAVFGTGVSGMAARGLLERLGIESVFYAQENSKRDGEISGAELEPFSKEAAKNHALVIYSPAFRPDHEWIKTAEDAGATAICEPDLSALAWDGKIIAVTGTNGKTTVTSFITHALKSAGFDALSAGNIGEPLSAFCDGGDNSKKIAVCELSSFQTFRLKYLRPDALLWTNFAPDHLDWHKDLREYFGAKFRLVENLKGKMLVAGESVAEAAKEYGRELPCFSAVLKECGSERGPVPFDTSVQSKNFFMARELLRSFGISDAEIEDSARTFSLPAHRFSRPIEARGVKFYNDSKATNAHAAIAALEELKGAPNLIWLGGGKDKHCELSELVKAVKESAKGAVLIGETAEILKNELGGLPLGAIVKPSMEDAVKAAAEMANGGSVLFSPGFSSFGMFSGYADRGKSFESAVLCLK